jgi:hypothetical protein
MRRQRLCGLIVMSMLLSAGCGSSSNHRTTDKATITDTSREFEAKNSAGSLEIPADSLDVGTKVSLDTGSDLDLGESGTSASGALQISATKSGSSLVESREALSVSVKLSSSGLTLASTDDLCVVARPTYDKTKFLVWRRADLDVSGGTATVGSRYFGTYQAAYCGSNTFASGIEQVTWHPRYDPIQGTWTRACANQDGGTFAVSGLGFVERSNHYSASTCTSASLVTTLTVIGDIDVEGNATLTGAKNWRYRVRSIKYKIASQSYVDSFNAAEICGKTDWAINTDTEIKNLDCGTVFDRPMKTVETVWYRDIFSISSRTLSFGEYTDTYTGVTAATRPVALNGVRVFKK